MVEVLFGEAEAAAMKRAKEKNYISGNPDGVICLALMLDIGDITKDINSSYRREMIYNMYSQNCNDNESLEELRDASDVYFNEQKRLMDFISKGEQVRIWFSNVPYSMCGLYYICSLMKNVKNVITAVKLPDYVEVNDRIMEYQGWGEISPEKFYDFLGYEKRLSNSLIVSYSNKWNELKDDNSVLRANINGELTGVSETFYDYLVYKHIRKLGEVREVALIGDIIGKHPLGVGDWWYASRIDKMLQKGELKIIEDSYIKYKRIICAK